MIILAQAVGLLPGEGGRFWCCLTCGRVSRRARFVGSGRRCFTLRQTHVSAGRSRISRRRQSSLRFQRECRSRPAPHEKSAYACSVACRFTRKDACATLMTDALCFDKRVSATMGRRINHVGYIYARNVEANPPSLFGCRVEIKIFLLTPCIVRRGMLSGACERPLLPDRDHRS